MVINGNYGLAFLFIVLGMINSGPSKNKKKVIDNPLV